MTGLLVALAIVFGTIYLGRVIKRAVVIFYDATMRAAAIASFSRYGDFDDVKVVILDDETGYFIREGALWKCDVVDDIPQRSTAKLLDVINLPPQDLESVIEAVEALNTEY